MRQSETAVVVGARSCRSPHPKVHQHRLPPLYLEDSQRYTVAEAGKTYIHLRKSIPSHQSAWLPRQSGREGSGIFNRIFL
jgi:hypothetical protein